MHGATMNESSKSHCRFCAVTAGGGDVFDSRWHSTADYAALVSVGAFVPGWTLVCPVAHAANLLGHYSRADFWDFVSATAAMVESQYGKSVIFEHGAARETSLTGCGVGHAHLHIVPLQFSLQSAAVEASEGHLVWQRCDAREIAFTAEGREYLFVADHLADKRTEGLICLLEAPTSQFFRRVIADRLGMPDSFDYKTHPMLDIAKSSAAVLRVVATDVVEA